MVTSTGRLVSKSLYARSSHAYRHGTQLVSTAKILTLQHAMQHYDHRHFPHQYPGGRYGQPAAKAGFTDYSHQARRVESFCSLRSASRDLWTVVKTSAYRTVLPPLEMSQTMPDRSRSLLMLTSNAYKFTPAGGKLVITTKLVPPTPSRIFVSWQALNNESQNSSPPGHELPSVQIDGTPQSSSSPHSPDSNSETRHGLSATLLNQHDVLRSFSGLSSELRRRIRDGIRHKNMM